MVVFILKYLSSKEFHRSISFIKKMASRFFILTCSLSRAFQNVTKESTNTFFKKFKINYLSIYLYHSNISNLVFDSGFLDNKEVQKYLNFIESDPSYIKNLSALDSNKLQYVLQLLEKKKKLRIDLKQLQNMPLENDKELENLMEEEKNSYLYSIEKINYEILENILPINDENENRNVEIQIVPAVGGDEAKLFAEELYNLYLNYVKYKNWCCPASELRGQKSELRSAYILVSGNYVYSYLKHEAGVHRVQRVPETEKMGRTHTSTCSVMILPQPKPEEIIIKKKDVIVEKMRSSGPGGQNVNKTESCIRIKHLPTGIVIENQTSRFQYENKALAFERLRGVLYNMKQQQIQTERKVLKKQQVGSNDYSDKIRTYNFSQNRVTDHRINYSVHNMKAFMSGTKELDEMICRLEKFMKKGFLLNHIEKILHSVNYEDFTKNKISN